MAKSYPDALEAQAHKILDTVLVRAIDNPCSTISSSAYDTAWVAMIGDPEYNYEKPMFNSCLEWILNNQKPEGFWGDQDYCGNSTFYSFIATLTCMVALKTWNLGHDQIAKGLAFVNANTTKLLQLHDKHDDYPRNFTIVFSGVVELARRIGLQVLFDDEEVKEAVARVFHQRNEILKSELLADMYHYPPLLSHLEVLPPNFPVDVATILTNMNAEGDLFRSPSATAAAFMASRNSQMLSYLCRLVQNCNNGGVPSMYPIDKDYIPTIMVNHLQRLGISEYFPDLIHDMLEHIYREYIIAHKPSKLCDLIPENIYKSSLAFQLLRLQGYKVSARKFCWFLNDENALKYIEENHENFTCALYNLYRATSLMFESEEELQELRSFSRKLLAKSCLSQSNLNDSIILWSNLQEKIKDELATPWLARMDHLEHRDWIESANSSPIWLGKSSYSRISCLYDGELLELAKREYELRQKIYQKELQELIRWSKECGLMDMGFAREKTTYCYFAVASATTLPYDSYVRLVVAKSAVLITMFDDYFDMKGSYDELQLLASAVKRWNSNGLKSHSKVLFDTLDDFVSEVANKYFDQYGIDIVDSIRKIWYEVVESWLTEATWSKTGYIPSMATYMETGMISIASHILVLQASCFHTPSLSAHKLINPSEYEYITKLLMISCRLLNDLQSYEKEVKDGKINSIYIYMKENPKANMKDAIHYVENILEETKMKLLEQALIMDGNDDEELPKPCKMLHLAALKVFQMFFNSANHFDSKDSLLNDINKAIFLPLEPQTSLQLKPQTKLHPPKKPRLVINSCNNVWRKYQGPWKPNHRVYCTTPGISTRSHHRILPSMKVNSWKFNLFVPH